MKIILFIPLLISLLLLGCSSNYNDNMEALDELYGKCDNPNRTLTKKQYKVCKAQEDAGDLNKDQVDILAIFNRDSKKTNNSGVSMSINPNLWQASLQILKRYPLENADALGGIIETKYIYSEENINQRCVIKILITSQEIISNGVNTEIICENKKADNWYTDQNNYLEEAKQITLSILKKANELKLSS